MRIRVLRSIELLKEGKYNTKKGGVNLQENLLTGRDGMA